jgi:hypothetical protein
MSTTHTAYTVVGVRLHENQLVRYRKVRGCNCFDVDTRNEFCPHCGARVWKQHKSRILKVDVDDGQSLTANIKLIQPHYECKDFFAGMVFSCDNNWAYGEEKACWDFKYWPDEKVVRSIRAELKKLLEPHGVWDERGFGVYTFVGVR